MKKLLIYIVVLTCWGLTITSCKDNDDPDPVIIEDSISSITVNISEINELKGVLHVALFNSEDDWNKDVVNDSTGSEFLIKREEAKTSEQEVVFEDVPTGTYGISIYQDLNNNGELDRIAGILPGEPYGFSNNAKPDLRAPKFDECNFVVEEKKSITLNIELIGS